MAKLKMQKIEIISELKNSRNIIERLQRRGVVELYDITDDGLVKLNTSSSISQFEKNLLTAKAALDTVMVYSDKKPSLLDSLNGREAIDTVDFANRKKDVVKILKSCAEINGIKKDVTDSQNEVAKYSARIDILSPWIKLDIPQSFKGTKTTVSFIGTLAGHMTESMLYSKAEEYNKELDFYVEIITDKKELTNVFILASEKQKDILSEFLNSMGFNNFQSDSKLTVGDEIEDCKEHIKEYQNKIADDEKKISTYQSSVDDIKFVIDFLTMRIDKYDALSKLAVTDNTVIITGYIPEKYVNGLIKEFEEKYENIAINIDEIPHDEEAPVLLSNSKFSEPVDTITEMYALPNKHDVDPSSVMAFFYYLFFGMMLSDAGYGLVMTVATFIILKKTTVEGKLRKSLTMFNYCGISTLFWGILFGSWFGDLPNIIASNFFGTTIKTTALWFEPINNPIKLLLFSFGLGICHLFLGLGVRFGMIWKDGKKFDAICDVIPIYITILGVAPLGASLLADVPMILMTIGKYMAIVGAILIVFTSGRASKNIFMRFFGGIYGLYNIATGYLSDILSYSRLLALGLATGSIASVINMIAVMPSNVFVKAIMLVVVGIIGHTANMAINLLGAYVHTDRLQFVELFSKFYEGGGTAFKPLSTNTKYIKFKKENIYE